MNTETTSSVSAARMDRYDIAVFVIPVLLLAASWLLGWWQHDTVRFALVFSIMVMINLRLAVLSSAWKRYSRPLLIALALSLSSLQAAVTIGAR